MVDSKFEFIFNHKDHEDHKGGKPLSNFVVFVVFVVKSRFKFTIEGHERSTTASHAT
jgi:hypothetical protein